MATNDDYVARLLSALTAKDKTRSSLQTGSELIRAVTGAQSMGQSAAQGGLAGEAPSVAGVALQIGSRLLSQGKSVSAASAAQSVGRDLLSSSPVGLLGNFLWSYFSDDGGTPATPQLPRYQAATPVQYNLGVSGSGYTAVDSGETSLPRSAGATGGSAQRDVVIQVQAMDSRSFLDHSNEIAEAVRKALLDSHPLRDVLTE